MVKLSLFSNDIILFLRESTEKLLQITKEFSKLQYIKLTYSNE